MTHIDIKNIHFIRIVTNFGKISHDKHFRLYACLWILLLSLVAVYSWSSVLKSIESYNNPDRTLTVKIKEQIEFPVLVFCASNTDSIGFKPSSCYFAQKGAGSTPIYECDYVQVNLTLLISETPHLHSCIAIRGVKVNKPQQQAQQQSELLLNQNPSGKSLKQGQMDSLKLIEETVLNKTVNSSVTSEVKSKHSILDGRIPANATVPSSQFQIHFDTNSTNVIPFKNVLFHIVIHKTVTEKESKEHKYIPDTKNYNPIYVPKSVDSWTRLYPARTEDIIMESSTTTYLDETVVYKYRSTIRPIPCVLPGNEDCTTKVSAHIRFVNLEVEDAEERVTFDWLYVLGAIGGAMTISEVAFIILFPIFERILFGGDNSNENKDEKKSNQNKSNSTERDSDETERKPFNVKTI